MSNHLTKHPITRTSASAMSINQLQETHAALSTKVRQQAIELTETLDVLQETQRYVEILEERLQQAIPDHPFPVTEEHLKLPIVPQSSIPKPLASSLRANTMTTSSGNSPSNTRASTGSQSINELSLQVSDLRAKLEDSQRRFREAHSAIDRKEKEKVSISNKCDVLAKRVCTEESL